MSDGPTQPPALPEGWYDDPDDPTQWRYWGGRMWTDHRSPKQPTQPAAASAEQSPTASDRAASPWVRWAVWAGLIGLLVFAVVAGISELSDTAARPASSSAVNDMSALEQMEVAFEGDYSRAAIEARMREAMDLYDLAWTEDNRSRAASALVALRRESGIEEMRILDYMICSHVPEADIRFGEAAAFAVSFLEHGDGCR